MQVDVLGPLRVRRGDQVIPVASARLLVRLAIAPGQVVPIAEVIDAVWPDDPPADAPNAVQSLVSRLRRALGDAAAVQQADGGYRVDLSPAATDVHRFAELATAKR